MAGSDELSLGTYLDEWLERRRTQLRPTTSSGYCASMERYVRPHLGTVPLSRLDRRMLERLYARLLASGGVNGKSLSPRTVQLAHAILHRALEDAKLDGLLDDNPAAMARPPKRDPAEVELDDDLHVWTTAEVARFLQAVDDHPLRGVWHTAIGTGARRGEVLGLRWQDVDPDGRTVCIRRSLTVVDGVPRLLGTKTSRSRTLSIGVSVIDALERERTVQQARRRDAGEAWQDRWGLVFTDAAGRPVEPMAFRRLVRDLDVPVIRLHDLRHMHASLLLEQQTPIKVVSERLGHATIAMTMDVYAHVMPAMDEDAVTRLDATIHGDADDAGDPGSSGRPSIRWTQASFALE